VFYFGATDGTIGYELWKSNGITTGTVMVKDIYPDAGDGISGDYFGPL
jgi:ELWxxDGT repeat protein